MNLLFRYRWNHHEPVYGHPPYLVIVMEVPDASEQIIWGFNKYLLSALSSDLNDPAWCDIVLDRIAKLERGELKETGWGGMGFNHFITPTKVTFEHAVFEECPEWPLWSCSLAQYKAALMGWRKFLDMPKDIDTELIVELPD